MAFKKKKGADSEPGTKTYKLTQQHYRLSRLYEPGETITVPEAEKPGKTWVLLDNDGEEVEAVEAPSEVSDTNRSI